MAKKRILSLNAMDKIIRESGALRVSDDAKRALSEVLKEKGLKISSEARKFAEHAGRKTVTEEDIKLAVEKY